MAITYSLELGTSQPAAPMAAELCEVGRILGLFDQAVTADSILGDGAVTAHGTWIRVFTAHPRPWNAVIVDLGFTPTVTMMFRLDKSTDISAQLDDVISLVSGLLDRVPGDAVLHFDYEYIMLLRRNGDLSLNERSDIWPPQRLAAVQQPYHRATHAFS